jgi:hypothetical protein
MFRLNIFSPMKEMSELGVIDFGDSLSKVQGERQTLLTVFDGNF